MLDSPVSQAAFCAKSGETDRVLDDLRLIDMPLPSRQVLSCALMLFATSSGSSWQYVIVVWLAKLGSIRAAA